MILSIERVKDKGGTNIRFMKEVLPWNVQKFMEYACSIENFILTFANSTIPLAFINATPLRELSADFEEVKNLHEELRHNLDVLFVPSYMKFYNIDGDNVSEISGINYKVNQCSLVLQCRQTYLETAFSYVLPEEGQDEIFTERTLVKFNSLSEIFPLLFSRLISSVLAGEQKEINKCSCGKFFIPTKGKEQRYCSDVCRRNSYKTPYYRKYKHRYQNINDHLTLYANKGSGDPEVNLKKLEELYKKWKAWVNTLLPTAETTFDSPESFGKEISAEWKRLRKEVC